MSKFLKRISNRIFLHNIKNYEPRVFERPDKMLDVKSAWEGHELIIKDIINRFQLNTARCLEFGVEFGYSAVVFSNYFEKVTGVDTFRGDEHTLHKGDHFELTKSRLLQFENIELIQSDYKEFIQNNDDQYDLIHVDIVHTYADTYACGLWSALHSTCTLFHDTESFPEVKKAVHDIAKKTGKTFYNYKPHYGLGILV